MKPISETAFYCCGARMLDARSAHPIANDSLAHKFMTSQGQAIFKRFANEKIANAACVVRHHLIDSIVEEFLFHNQNPTVILIGAGFDTRAYRFRSGSWYELDEYQLIDFKNSQLPIENCPNNLHRFSVDFSSDELDLRLSTIKPAGPVMIIVEGVFMYLNNPQITALLATVKKYFPQHQLVCDLMTRRFQMLFGHSIQRKIRHMGNRFTTTTSPEQIFADNHYRRQDYTSIVGSTLSLQALPLLPASAGFCLPRTVKKGYGIYHFQFD